MKLRWLAACIAMTLLSAGSSPYAVASPLPNPGTKPVDQKEQKQLINALIAAFNSDYVFADVAKKLESELHADLRKNLFARSAAGPDLANALTQRLREITRDKHIRVFYSATPLPPQESDGDTAEEAAAEQRRMEKRNFSIARVERLNHNIGYINLKGFDSAEAAAESIAATMQLVAYTDALIIDLRENGGGYPSGVAQIESYFFDRPTLLYTMYVRKENSSDDVWTSEAVKGPRYGEKRPVFLLTSGKTFSGGEDMAYTMQQLKRAVIVGETTGGGANAGGRVRLSDHFSAFIPSARPINAVTKGNWEGRGVQPDVAAPAADALKTAQILALRKLIETEGDPATAERMRVSVTELEQAP